MFESIFGADMPLAMRFFIAFVIVLGLIGVTAWVVRRFGADRLGSSSGRGRQPRLAVIDAAAVDGRRRLVLIRRDNVEHLLMIGGPTDVVVELNIVRAAAGTREATPARPAAAADSLPRAVPLGEGTTWPLQPEPVPAARAPRPPVVDEPMQWPADPEPPPQPAPRRQSRPVDPLAGLAAELSRSSDLPRSPAPPDLGAATPTPREREPMRETMRERESVRETARMREPPPPPSITDPEYAANADQNLADMARHLEAALRRPPKGGEGRPVETQRPMPAAEPPFVEIENPEPLPAPPPRGPRAVESVPTEARPARTEAKQPRAEPKQQKSVYDSLEQEMASLLGRPNSKS
jgi:flagellar protein FliO/FliZ